MRIIYQLQTFIKDSKSYKGFTIIELMVYTGILCILIAILSTLFGSVINVQTESQSTSTVDLDGRYILAKLTSDFHNATAIVSPSIAQLGQTQTSLQLTINAVNYSYSLNNGNMQLTIPSVGTDNLNNVYTKVSNLTFTRYGNGDPKDTIKISFTLSSLNTQRFGTESATFQTTLALE